jgi:hypothetical protein
MSGFGTCTGRTGIGDCAYTGWSCAWQLADTVPQQFRDLVDGLVNGQVVCMYCVLDRADDAKIPGFNKQKYNRIKGKIGGINCGNRDAGSPQETHGHIFDMDGEVVWPAFRIGDP